MAGVIKKGPPTSFSPATSANVRIGLQNFLTLSFNLFDRVVENSKIVTSASLTLLNFNQDQPPKRFFWSNPYKTDVMTTSFIQMLQLPNFGHMNTCTI